jgi:hypothetical protein
LLVTPKGAKLWQHRYRVGGKPKLQSLGLARAKRDAARGALAGGHDPSRMVTGKDGALVPAERLFATVAADWHANASKGWCYQNSKQIWARVSANVLPVFAQMAIDEIGPLDVLAALQRIEARGAVDSARRIRADISAIFDFAETGGMGSNQWELVLLSRSLAKSRKCDSVAVVSARRHAKPVSSIGGGSIKSK